MRFIDQLRSTRHTFSANRVRAALTLLGVMIGTGSIVLLAGLLRGGEEALLLTSHRANEADLVRVRRDEPPSEQATKTRRPLSRNDAEALEASPLLEAAPVAYEAQQDIVIESPKRTRLRMVGAAPIARSLYRLEVEKGRFISDDDLAARRRVCVVGQRLWQELFEGRDAIGDARLTLSGHIFTVVGVLKKKPLLSGGDGGFWTWNGKVLIPRTSYDALFSPAHEANQLYVRLGETPQLAAKVATTRAVIGRTLLRLHLGVRNFTLDNKESEQEQERLILAVVKLLLLGTGFVALIVGGINIMNIMLVTVTERTREIGVRRAVGAAPRAILVQFLIESALIALVGGALGVLAGVGLSWTAALALQRMLGQWNFHVELWSIALALGMALLTGVAFGIMPAQRAARLDPIEALRYM